MPKNSVFARHPLVFYFIIAYAGSWIGVLVRVDMSGEV